MSKTEVGRPEGVFPYSCRVDGRVKACATCGHPKSHHRTRECRHTWQTRGQTFMGIRDITKWCTCDGYQAMELS